MSEQQRVSLRELAARAASKGSVSGLPANACPYCGGDLMVNGTTTLTAHIERHVYCRNESCGKGFITRQPQATILREINRQERNKLSSSGNAVLTVFRETA